jgi:hypothetical protein
MACHPEPVCPPIANGPDPRVAQTLALQCLRHPPTETYAAFSLDGADNLIDAPPAL